MSLHGALCAMCRPSVQRCKRAYAAPARLPPTTAVASSSTWSAPCAVGQMRGGGQEPERGGEDRCALTGADLTWPRSNLAARGDTRESIEILCPPVCPIFSSLIGLAHRLHDCRARRGSHGQALNAALKSEVASLQGSLQLCRTELSSAHAELDQLKARGDGCAWLPPHGVVLSARGATGPDSPQLWTVWPRFTRATFLALFSLQARAAEEGDIGALRAEVARQAAQLARAAADLDAAKARTQPAHSSCAFHSYFLPPTSPIYPLPS